MDVGPDELTVVSVDAAAPGVAGDFWQAAKARTADEIKRTLCMFAPLPRALNGRQLEPSGNLVETKWKTADL